MDFGIIGNCAYSALVEQGAIRWLCWPRMDSSFVFGSLLDERKGGEFSVEAVDGVAVEQRYVDNTNILRTLFEGPQGSFELIDFAPRFRQYDRYFKPTMLIRILRPLSGDPVVRVRCRPVYDYGRSELESWTASNHIAYQGLPAPLRLTTNLSLTQVSEGRPFVLSRDQHLVLTYGQPLESALEETAESFLQRTTAYWRRWVKHCRIPRDYQDEVIRSALVLKLHQFEDTGALLASTTTSLPEFPGSGRNWDYRYCWLRDAYFTLAAMERLGHYEEMEMFLRYLRNICETQGHELRPVYSISGASGLDEEILDHLAGYRGEGPVRVGNQAWEHVQNDVYGEMILTVSRLLLDKRFFDVEGLSGIRGLVQRLLGEIERRLEEPDAGLWELRETRQLHGFTLLTHWAGAEKALEIARVEHDDDMARKAKRIMDRARKLLERECWDEERGVLTQAAAKSNLDAGMLMAVHFGFFSPEDPRARSHVEAIAKGLSIEGPLLRRYDVEDDFGYQESAFTVCSFWLAEALAIVGRSEESRELFELLLSLQNGLGLYSEDILPETMEQSGNFPQTYSHVGLINTAFRLSRPWE